MYRIFIVVGMAGLLAMLLSLPMWPSLDQPHEAAVTGRPLTRADGSVRSSETEALLVPVKESSEDSDVFVNSVLTYSDDKPLTDYR
jgi:hypothetical protein